MTYVVPSLVFFLKNNRVAVLDRNRDGLHLLL